MPEKKDEPAAIGIIGGSGLYQIEELRDSSELNIDTPFGPPSDLLVGGKLSGRQVYFLPRHGRGRSEERRVGKECRSRWSPDHEKKKRREKEKTGNVYRSTER